MVYVVCPCTNTTYMQSQCEDYTYTFKHTQTKMMVEWTPCVGIGGTQHRPACGRMMMMFCNGTHRLHDATRVQYWVECQTLKRRDDCSYTVVYTVIISLFECYYYRLRLFFNNTIQIYSLFYKFASLHIIKYLLA